MVFVYISTFCICAENETFLKILLQAKFHYVANIYKIILSMKFPKKYKIEAP